MDWLVLVVKLTGAASRTRVGVWRELRKIGAAPVASSVWTVPDTPPFSDGVPKVVELAEHGCGSVLVMPTPGGEGTGAAGLLAAFTKRRVDEWEEFVGDCGAFEPGMAKEMRSGTFALAELEEKEQSLDRLRSRSRGLKSRDVLALPEALAAEEHLRDCAAVFEAYACAVYATLHVLPGRSGGVGPCGGRDPEIEPHEEQRLDIGFLHPNPLGPAGSAAKPGPMCMWWSQQFTRSCWGRRTMHDLAHPHPTRFQPVSRWFAFREMDDSLGTHD